MVNKWVFPKHGEPQPEKDITRSFFAQYYSYIHHRRKLFLEPAQLRLKIIADFEM